MINGFKQCSRCKEYKHIDQFHKNKSRVDGRVYECRDCKRKLDKQVKSTMEYKLSALKSRHKRRSIVNDDIDIVIAYTLLRGESCTYCGEITKLTLDHFVPVSKGGNNDINNLIPCCKHCNSSKNAHNPIQWLMDNNIPLSINGVSAYE
jgi:5-methylcytosine-specific restriction endonuclease McrA